MEPNANQPVGQPLPEGQVSTSEKLKIPLITLGALLIIGAACASYFFIIKPAKDNNGTSITASTSPITYEKPLVDVPFIRQSITINKDIAQPFTISEIKNVNEMEKSWGVTFTKDEMKKLEDNKFVIKNLLDTNLGNNLSVAYNTREFAALYSKISGSYDYKERTPANALFISSDVLFTTFSILSAELLKETENKYLFSTVASISKTMYEKANDRYNTATNDRDKKDWMKVRDYFAVPYALTVNAQVPMSATDYLNQQGSQSLDEMQAAFKEKDTTVDTIENTSAFIKNLKLESDEEGRVLADLKQVYDAQESRGIPATFGDEYAALSDKNIIVKIPFTLFKPRGTYTSSSLRRQYFRAVQWYQQIPFLLASPDLTRYSVKIADLFHENKDLEDSYRSFSSLIAFVVGESDDLDVSDYIAAETDLGKDKVADQASLRAYLDKRKPSSKIKALPVDITSEVTVKDEIDAMRGMRFMSQKFIPDSYWTSRLSQGDEKADANGLRLPDRVSSLEVMSILGSPYATSRLSDLPFYDGEGKAAIDTRLKELGAESKGWDDNYWMSNLYTSTLWTLKGMFSWLDANRTSLPSFMQSPLWNAKTLLTASGFWTELRHTSILYAKQSFAEKGGGGDDMCDDRTIPEPPKGYIEPQAEGYDRLLYTATRLKEEYKARGYDLQNLSRLDTFMELLNKVRDYTKLELENTALTETSSTTVSHSYDDKKDCVIHILDENHPSPWEDIRVNLARLLNGSFPSPVEGPVLEVKDRRSAVVADIHTDKNDTILEEGTGVPRVIFVAIKDANGPRLTVGFTYSQYETWSGERLTDEQWQDNFYTDSGDYQITYKPKSSWPAINTWFQDLLGSK